VESLWDRVTQSLKEGFLTAAEKTEELAKVGKGKLDLMAIRHKISHTFAELGGKVYHLVTVEKTTAIAGNKEVKALVQRVKALEKQLKGKEAEIQRMREGASS
jgi:hypothetical protein